MTSKSLLCAAVTSALLFTGAIAGCGGGDDDTSTTTGAPPFSPGNGPASAKDKPKDAPDNVISDRPGGPNPAPPVNPAPAK